MLHYGTWGSGAYGAEQVEEVMGMFVGNKL